MNELEVFSNNEFGEISVAGNWKCRNSEVITYFDKLSDLASKILKKDLEDCAKEETP